MTGGKIWVTAAKRKLFGPLMLIAVLAAGACGAESAPEGGNQVEQQGSDDSIGLNTQAPPCPFTADQVTDLIGQEMKDEGVCLFGDGRGVASLTVTAASQAAGMATYAYQREQASMRFGTVTDLGTGDRSYMGSKDVTGEAVVLSRKGAYTLTLNSFSKDTGWYAETLRKLASALPI